MTALYAASITLVASLVIIAIGILVSRARLLPKDPAASAAVYRIRAIYFTCILTAVVIALVITLPMVPYPVRFSGQEPDAVVNVTGEMWSWTLTPTVGGASVDGKLVLPAGKLVEFNVTSKDVNHNFALYNSKGRLMAQVQAMPNYTNQLFYRFKMPGQYYVLCLEYCGIAHHGMNTELDVK